MVQLSRRVDQPLLGCELDICLSLGLRYINFLCEFARLLLLPQRILQTLYLKRGGLVFESDFS